MIEGSTASGRGEAIPGQALEFGASLAKVIGRAVVRLKIPVRCSSGM